MRTIERTGVVDTTIAIVMITQRCALRNMSPAIAIV